MRGRSVQLQTQPSAKQRQILEFIAGFIRSNAISPSLREICAGVGTSSTSVVDYHISRLESMAYLKRRPRISRSIVLDEERMAYLGLAYDRAD